MEGSENTSGLATPLSADALAADIRATPGVRRVVFGKEGMFIEGSLPLSALKRGKFHQAVGAALNRVRKQAKLKTMLIKQWEVEWHAFRDEVMDYRLYAVGLKA